MIGSVTSNTTRAILVKYFSDYFQQKLLWKFRKFLENTCERVLLYVLQLYSKRNLSFPVSKHLRRTSNDLQVFFNFFKCKLYDHE